MLKRMLDSTLAIILVLFFLVAYFPGGTILMALSCDNRRLDGWDWVLSVVVPAYGLIKSIFSSYCYGPSLAFDSDPDVEAEQVISAFEFFCPEQLRSQERIPQLLRNVGAKELSS